MKAITLTNSKYQYMCSKSVKSFLRFNDLPVEIYFIGSEIENTYLKEYNCYYINIDNSKMPKGYRWYPEILKEKLKIFLLQKEDFLFFDSDVFFYKKLDFNIFKTGISGVREYAFQNKDYSMYLNAGFLIFKNFKFYDLKDIENYFNEKSDLPEEEFLYRYKEQFNYLDIDICFLNYPHIPFIYNPSVVHCVGSYKPFINEKEDPVKRNHYHYNKIYKLNL